MKNIIFDFFLGEERFIIMLWLFLLLLLLWWWVSGWCSVLVYLATTTPSRKTSSSSSPPVDKIRRSNRPLIAALVSGWSDPQCVPALPAVYQFLTFTLLRLRVIIRIGNRNRFHVRETLKIVEIQCEAEQMERTRRRVTGRQRYFAFRL